MGVEVVKANLEIAETKSDKNMSVDSDNVNIKFGSHGVDDAVKRESDKVSESNLPKDVVDEWPEPQQIHSFYIVRYRAFEDQNLKAKLDLAEKELQKKNQLRLQIVEKLRTKRGDRSELIAQLRSLSAENKQFRTIMDEKRKEMEPLQHALGKLRGPGGRDRDRDRSMVICSSEEELNEIIRSLQYRIQHESIPLSEEKQILREIKQLEGTREKVIANAAERARIQDSMGEKDVIQDQVKSIGVDLDGVRKEKQVVNAKLKQLDEAKLAIEKEIGVLESELTAVTEKRDATFETIKNLRKQREEGNAPFYQNRTLLTKAKSLAANKDVDALKEFSNDEVEKFTSLWNSNKAFRDDYERRILTSLDMRQLSKDGRLRNPGEKPLLLRETTTSETEVVKAIVNKAPQENAISPAQVDAASSEQKVQKTKGTPKEGNKKKEITMEETDTADQEEFFSSNKLQKNKEDQVDEQKLKELKRQEEIAKRKQAEERKKKLAEKAAAKAAIKAQKEAEKKLKEREKKARRKTGATFTTVDSEEATDATPEATEPEKEEENVETAPAPQKNKETKDNIIRPRGRPRGQNSLPKAILKRKKATNYWLWAGGTAAAALVALILAIVGYKYLN